MATADVTIEDLWGSPTLQSITADVNQSSFDDSLLLDVDVGNEGNAEDDDELAFGLFGVGDSTDRVLDVDLENYLGPLPPDDDDDSSLQDRIIDAASASTSAASCVASCSASASVATSAVAAQATPNKRYSVTGKRAHSGDYVSKRPKRPKSCIITRNTTLDLTTEDIIPGGGHHHSNENIPPFSVHAHTPAPAAVTSAVPHQQHQSQTLLQALGINVQSNGRAQAQGDGQKQDVPEGYQVAPNPITASLAARLTAACESSRCTNSFNQHPLRCRAATPHQLPDVADALAAVKRAARGWQDSLSAPASAPAAFSTPLRAAYRQTALVARSRKPGAATVAAARKKSSLTRFDSPVVPAKHKQVYGHAHGQMDQRFASALTPLQSYMQSAL